MDPAVLIAIVVGLVTIITSSITAYVTLRNQAMILAHGLQLAQQGAVIQTVKEQNDGINSRLSAQVTASQEEAKTATRDASVARAETIAATAAGDVRVAEANRTHEASSAAIEAGTHKAVAPIAKAAVVEGTREAVAGIKAEAENGSKAAKETDVPDT